MSHRPLYKKTSSCAWNILLVTLLAIAGVYYLYHKWLVFSPERIVSESVLKAKTFATPVEEISSPRYGIKAYLFEEKTNPIISVSFMFKNAGWASDSADEQGIANLVSVLLGEGAGKLNAQQWKEELESKAIAISWNADKDDFSGNLLTTVENADRAFELLQSVLSEPRFEVADIARVKAQMQEALKRQREHPASVLNLDFATELYGTHPYGRNPLGESKAIAAIDREQLQKFVKNNFSRQNLVVGIAGDMTPQAAMTMLDKVFGSLPEKGALNFVREAEIKFDGRHHQISKASGQNIATFATQGVERSSPDFYPLFVANYIVGGSGLSSRLSKSIRENEGLTYGVYSYLTFDDKAPLLQAGFATTAENYEQALQMFAEQWQRFGEQGATSAEVKQAKNYLVASYNLRFAAIGNIAEMMTAMQKYNLGQDFLQKRNSYVEAVKVDEVNTVAKKYFNNEKLVGMSIGKFKNETEEK